MASPIPPEHLPRILRGGVSIDEIEARLRCPRHVRIEPEPSWKECFYALAGAFAAGVLVWVVWP